jgi:hypothetical protein
MRGVPDMDDPVNVDLEPEEALKLLLGEERRRNEDDDNGDDDADST